MSSPTKRERKSKESSLARPEAEVEALLRAAQDALLLKLCVDSHPISSRASSSSDALDSDLARCFQALKSPPPMKPVGRGATAAADDDEWGRILGDDLTARFAAVKGSSSGPNPGIQQPDLMSPNLGDSDDEVAAAAVGYGCGPPRSLQGNGGEKDDDGESTDDDDEEEEEEEDLSEKKWKEMNKGKPKKKFFFF